MSSKTTAPVTTRKAWTTPTLNHRGSVGEILLGGGGKLSLAGSDTGEMRCEKPHVSQCS